MLTTESITPAHTAASAAATSTLHVDSSVTMFRFASSSYNSDSKLLLDQDNTTQLLTLSQDSIRVTLQCSTNSVSGAAIRHPTRQLKLPSNGSVIPIGRASKSSAKDLQPTPHNAFFDCAVMSRNHAELYLKGVILNPQPRHLNCADLFAERCHAERHGITARHFGQRQKSRQGDDSSPRRPDQVRRCRHTPAM